MTRKQRSPAIRPGFVRLAEADLKEAAAPLASDKPWAADESLTRASFKTSSSGTVAVFPVGQTAGPKRLANPQQRSTPATE